MVFVLTDWLRGTAGVDFALLQVVNGQALQITANLPQVTDSVDLSQVHHQLVRHLTGFVGSARPKVVFRAPISPRWSWHFGRLVWRVI